MRLIQAARRGGKVEAARAEGERYLAAANASKKRPEGGQNRDIPRCNGGTDAYPALLQERQNR